MSGFEFLRILLEVNDLLCIFILDQLNEKSPLRFKELTNEPYINRLRVIRRLNKLREADLIKRIFHPETDLICWTITPKGRIFFKALMDAEERYTNEI